MIDQAYLISAARRAEELFEAFEGIDGGLRVRLTITTQGVEVRAERPGWKQTRLTPWSEIEACRLDCLTPAVELVVAQIKSAGR